MTRESGFFKILYLKDSQDQTDKYWFTIHVPIGCVNFTSHVQFESDALIMDYQQYVLPV